MFLCSTFFTSFSVPFSIFHCVAIEMKNCQSIFKFVFVVFPFAIATLLLCLADCRFLSHSKWFALDVFYFYSTDSNPKWIGNKKTTKRYETTTRQANQNCARSFLSDETYWSASTNDVTFTEANELNDRQRNENEKEMNVNKTTSENSERVFPWSSFIFMRARKTKIKRKSTAQWKGIESGVAVVFSCHWKKRESVVTMRTKWTLIYNNKNILMRNQKSERKNETKKSDRNRWKIEPIWWSFVNRS